MLRYQALPLHSQSPSQILLDALVLDTLFPSNTQHTSHADKDDEGRGEEREKTRRKGERRKEIKKVKSEIEKRPF